MRLRSIAMWGLNILFILILVLGCSKREKIVARIGRKNVITLGELREDFLRAKSKKKLDPDDLPELKKRLDLIINQRLRIVAAYENDLDEESTILGKIEPVRRQHLINRLYDTEIVDQVLKESLIREFYTQTGKEIILRTIAFLCPNQASPQEEEKIKEKAMNVLQRIRSGEDFAELARAYSEDKSSAINGGLTEPLSFTFKDDPVRHAAFTMREGQVSDVLKDDLSYQIIKIEEIRNKERKPYNQVRDEIRRQLATMRRKELSDKASAYWQDLLKENLVQWNEDVLAFLIEQMKSLDNPVRNAALERLDALNEGEKEKIIVNYKRGKISIGDFKNKLGEMPAHTSLPVDNRLKGLIEQWLMGDMLSEKALKKGLDNDMMLKNEIKKVLEKEMIQVLNQRYIFGEINPSDDDIMAYYEENKKEKYLEPEQVQAQEVMVEDEALAKKITNWARAGKNFDELAREYTERAGYKRKAGILNYFRRGRWGAVGREAFSLEKGEIAGPVKLDNNRGYSVIKLLDRKPAQIKPFEEVRNIVQKDLINNIKNEKLAEWISENKKVFNVQIFEKVLENAVYQKT